MDDQERKIGDAYSVNIVREVKLDEDEEDFRSCCEEEDDAWKETEELVVKEEVTENLEAVNEEVTMNLDEFSTKMLFKGVSIAEPGDSGCGFSGIGVVMERSPNFPVLEVQKKLDFYVEESVADYLALLDGLAEAVKNNIRHVYAFTDSQLLYYRVSLWSLKMSFLQHLAYKFQYVIKLAPTVMP